MNEKGFFNAMIAVIVVFLIASMLFIQASAGREKKEQTAQRAIFELKWGMQNIQFLLDNAAADAMHDAAVEDSCNIATTNYTGKVTAYFGAIISMASQEFGIQCNPIQLITLVISNNAPFTFRLSCSKETGTVRIEAAKDITLFKEAILVQNPPCQIRIQDKQSNTCDIPQSTSPC